MSELPTPSMPLGGFDWTYRRRWVWAASLLLRACHRPLPLVQ